ncbi:hypothetical protein ES703_13583 [subsurface metagenome]
MPEVWLSDTRRIRHTDGLVVVEYLDVDGVTWTAEKKPQTIYCDPWILDTTNNGWTPAHHEPIAGANFPYAQVEYDPGTEECAFWRFALPPNFDPDEDIIIKVYWKASTAFAGDVVWGVSVLGREEGDDINAAALETEVPAAADTVQGVVEQLTVTTITLTQAQHNLDPDDMVILKLARKAGDDCDNMADDADVVMIKADIAIDPAILVAGMPS